MYGPKKHTKLSRSDDAAAEPRGASQVAGFQALTAPVPRRVLVEAAYLVGVVSRLAACTLPRHRPPASPPASPPPAPRQGPPPGPGTGKQRRPPLARPSSLRLPHRLGRSPAGRDQGASRRNAEMQGPGRQPPGSCLRPCRSR